MANSLGPIRAEELRNLSGPQRASRFRDYMLQQGTFTPSEPTDETRWRPVDRELTPEQYLQIPAALRGGTRTAELWVKFRDSRGREPVVAKGYFDHDGAVWTASFGATEDNNCIRVVPIAWAKIVVGDGDRESSMRTTAL